MDTESLLKQLLELHHKKVQNISRTNALLAHTARQLNECAAATGSAVLIDASMWATLEATESSEPAAILRLACSNVTLEEVVDIGPEGIVEVLPHFPHWLSSGQKVAAAVNLHRIVDIYRDSLHRERSLRKVWRDILATLENNMEATHRDEGSALQLFTVLHSQIKQEFGAILANPTIPG